IKFIFETLYHSGNSTEAIYSALALVASHFSFERGYIFETDKDGTTTSNTFEWCAEGVSAEIDNLQKVPIEAASSANASFYKTGVFVLSSLDELDPAERAYLEPQGIQSMVQFGIFDKGQLLGFIGFDNCRSRALHHESEIEEIIIISNILATFFVKRRIDEAFMKDMQVQNEVMEHLNNYVYIIDPKSFKVLFMNSQTRKRMDNKECTTPCYDYFRGFKTQCKDCPIRELVKDHKKQIKHEIHNEMLGIWTETDVSFINWTDGLSAYLVECADITAQKEEHLQHIQQLEKLAFVDELTESRTFYKFKEDAKLILKKQNKKRHFLVKLDIENFKLVNQIYGFEVGDEILCCVAQAINKTIRNDNEIYARVFNDEFVGLFTMENEDTITKLYDIFVENFNTILDKKVKFKFTFAYGIYIIQKEDMELHDIMDLFEKVNVAHKSAKVDKKNTIALYDDMMLKKALHTKEIENKMATSLLNNEFIVYLQPKYALDNELIVGAEALTRWNNENKALFSPNTFIPVFEGNGFVTKLDFYILHKVCCIISEWIRNEITPVVVSVNFSRLHLSNQNFVKELCEIVDSVGIERKYIEIEITETAIYDNIDTLSELLTELHENGFTMSMDDFGSGYSSLGLLKDLSVDIIKMDRSFFANQKDAQRSKVVVRNVIKMGEELGIRIVAEGVEDQIHIDLLRELHCDMVQGYYYAKPMEVSIFTKLIQNPTKFMHKK
ncbi:MAG: sensor domain-containing phosphodiesterase, partial [Longicatena sp.]